MNACWLAVDMDLNGEAVQFDAPTGFQVVENLFAVYFTSEFLLRCLALPRKGRSRVCFKDHWLLFDSVIVVLMVIESWFMPMLFAIFGGSDNSLLMFKAMRFIRLTRMARVVKMLRCFPELMFLCRGMANAARAVCVLISLIVLFAYIFALLMRQATDSTFIGDKYFASVPVTMKNLLILAIVPDLGEVVDEVGMASLFWALVFICFVFVVGLIVTNMLVGVIVETVGYISIAEKEQHTANHLYDQILFAYHKAGKDPSENICLAEVKDLLGFPSVLKCMRNLDIDVSGVDELLHFNFPDSSKLIAVPEIVHTLSALRGSNRSTVRDLVILRKWMVQEMAKQMSCLKPVPDESELSTTRF